ncbi:NAD(P)H-quinone oxidoreductase [Microbacterium gorillae]|uniref:NAD(P)H-quinone oxidoreductase n=1 Tax=Microbacterium gorillae TaxID=1231063 RepID=UPI00058F2981|nr:NAD(P)H-quinone oxidoreductase [Microbacterium gorillae]
MKAIIATSPGDASVLSVVDVEVPEPGPGDIVIDVAAAGVNRADVAQRQGAYPPPAGAPAWLGLEASGRVSWAGPGSGHSVGDEVCALLSGGGYAEQVVVDGRLALPVPAGVALADAAALMETVCTVWSNVFQLAGLQPGENLLVHGGSSGIGTTAIQMGVEFGARVAVTASTLEKLEACRRLGAEVLINYRTEDFVQRVKDDLGGADVILDMVGGSYLARNVHALRTNGRIANIASMDPSPGELDFRYLMRKRGTIRSTSLRARPLAERVAIVTDVREHVWPRVADGSIRPIVHTTFPLAEATEAHRLMESSDHIGKILLIP